MYNVHILYTYTDFTFSACWLNWTRVNLFACEMAVLALTITGAMPRSKSENLQLCIINVNSMYSNVQAYMYVCVHVHVHVDVVDNQATMNTVYHNSQCPVHVTHKLQSYLWLFAGPVWVAGH